MCNAFNRLPTWAKVTMILAVLIVVGAVQDAMKANESPTTPKAQPATVAKPAKNVAERVFGSRVEAYTKSDDGRVLASFHAWTMTKDSVEGDVRRFMREMAKESDWSKVTVSAVATFYDDYGKARKDAVLTYTFRREDALLVEDWTKANLVAVGVREYVVPQLR